MTSNQDEAGNALLLDLTFSANAKLRTETAKLQVALDDQSAGIQALIEHASRVENHARHVETITKHKYESSFSWKITAPLRTLFRMISRILKSITIKIRS